MSYRAPLAWGKALMNRRKLGERVGLLVVGVHDWNAGSDLWSRPNTARVVVPDDVLPHELEWSPCVALDCVLVGECSESVFYASATMLYAAGAASIWAEFPDGFYRLERWASPLCPMWFYADDGPVPASRMGVALMVSRSWALMRREGVYGTKMFDLARDAEFEKAFGPLAAKAQAWVCEKRNLQPARSA